MAWPKFNTEDFAATSKEDWIAKALKDLKGASLDSINWHSEIGEINAIFHPEDQIPSIELPPRSVHNEDNTWEITQTFSTNDSNEMILASLMQGTSYLNIVVNKGEESILKSLLNQVHLGMIHLRIEGNADCSIVAKTIKEIAEEQGIDVKSVRGCLGLDILTSSIHNDSPITIDSLIKNASDQLGIISQLLPSMRTLPVQANRYFEAGATNGLEVALALHIGHTYIHAGLEKGLTIDEVANQLEFKLAAGSSYFLNCAKFRAFRSMWAKTIDQYSPAHDCTKVTWIEAKTSERFFSSNDHYNNLLRSTTSAMSAIVGSCDSLDVSNCSPSKQDHDELRYARNIQHLLREESWLDAAIDAGNGSYYIESITHKLITKAGSLLNELEQAGGLWSTEGKAWLFKQIEANTTKLISEVKNQQKWVIGVNKFIADEQKPELNSGSGGKLALFNVPFELSKEL